MPPVRLRTIRSVQAAHRTPTAKAVNQSELNRVHRRCRTTLSIEKQYSRARSVIVSATAQELRLSPHRLNDRAGLRRRPFGLLRPLCPNSSGASPARMRQTQAACLNREVRPCRICLRNLAIDSETGVQQLEECDNSRRGTRSGHLRTNRGTISHRRFGDRRLRPIREAMRKNGLLVGFSRFFAKIKVRAHFCELSPMRFESSGKIPA